MSITEIILLIAALGGLGGIVNCAMSGEFVLPRVERDSGIWRPGWIGNVLVGVTAAVVVWGVYGPLASYDLVHGLPQDVHLTVSQLLVSLVIGFSGGKILTLIADKQSESIASNDLEDTLKNLTEQNNEDNP